ncbi:hypothetical protein BHE74_00037386 [Ensete ventricosum]|nr:hypothetical protein BHE74_00037386 [Ensete ventricosum]RZR90376.1 hypothetical protein BHM03_00018234 [Ensete ventricosum]
MTTKRYELKDNSDDGGRREQQQRQLWLCYNFMAVSGVDCRKGAAAIRGRWVAVCMIVAEEGSSGMEQEITVVVFNLLLVAIKIVGNERLLQVVM